MSLTTLERVPVKVYKWNDVGAPVLNKTAGCAINILKECLVTGYGSKEPAGWTTPFEDTNTKVFRPEVGPHADFYLKLSVDTGTEVTPQVYLNMTNISNGDLKLQCTTPFKYAKGVISGKWLLVASPRGFWFFCEQSGSKSGAFCFAGDLSGGSAAKRAVYLQHTGGSSTSGNIYSSLLGYGGAYINMENNAYLYGMALVNNSNIIEASPISIANGSQPITSESHSAQALIIIGSELYILPGMFVPFNGAAYNNFEVVTITDGMQSKQAIVFGTGSYNNSNFYVTTNEWAY